MKDEYGRLIGHVWDYVSKGKLSKKIVRDCPSFKDLCDDFVGILWYNEGSPRELIAYLQTVILSEENEGLPLGEWGSMMHHIYMMLVLEFGDYGTSPRAGWIDRREEALTFLCTMWDVADGYPHANIPDEIEEGSEQWYRAIEELYHKDLEDEERMSGDRNQWLIPKNPCPICGAPATTKTDSLYTVLCSNPDCGVRVTHRYYAEAVSIWNKLSKKAEDD